MESILEKRLVSVGNYGNYKSENYGSSRYVKIGGLTLYFSYKTVIAYEFNGSTVVRENDWSMVTGKHLNAIDNGNKKERITGEVFEKQLTELLDTLGLGV
jgi:hypothetical protein